MYYQNELQKINGQESLALEEFSGLFRIGDDYDFESECGMRSARTNFKTSTESVKSFFMLCNWSWIILLVGILCLVVLGRCQRKAEFLEQTQTMSELTMNMKQLVDDSDNSVEHLQSSMEEDQADKITDM